MSYKYTFEAVFSDGKTESMSFEGFISERLQFARQCATELKIRYDHGQYPSNAPIGFQFEFDGKHSKYNWSIRDLG